MPKRTCTADTIAFSAVSTSSSSGSCIFLDSLGTLCAAAHARAQAQTRTWAEIQRQEEHAHNGASVFRSRQHTRGVQGASQTCQPVLALSKSMIDRRTVCRAGRVEFRVARNSGQNQRQSKRSNHASAFSGFSF